MANSLRSEADDRRGVRRLISGLVTKEESGFADAAVARDTVRKLVVHGLRTLCMAFRLEEAHRQEIEGEIRGNRLTRRVLKAWRALVDRSGPFRIAALKQLRVVRNAARAMAPKTPGDGSTFARLLEAARAYVMRMLTLARDEIERGISAVGDEAILLWYLQMRWWGRWARQDVVAVERVWTAWVPAADQAMRKLNSWCRDMFHLRLSWRDEEQRFNTWQA